jgi:GAF domain-containing protein
MLVETSDGWDATAQRLFDPTNHDELVRSTVRLTRLLFGAASSSIFLYDRDRGALVFEASSGESEDRLLGLEIPADRGIAGWVWSSGETVVVRDVDQDPRFAEELTLATGFVPSAIIAAPIEVDGEPVGVLEVLNPQPDKFGDGTAIEMLTELAQGAGAAMTMMLAARRLATDNEWWVERSPLLRMEAALRNRGIDETAIDGFATAVIDLLADRSKQEAQPYPDDIE